MKANVMVCYHSNATNGSWGFGNIDAYMEEISTEEIRDVEKQIKDNYGYVNVVIVNIIKFEKV